MITDRKGASMNRREFIKSLTAIFLFSILPSCKKDEEVRKMSKNTITYREWPNLGVKVSLLGYGLLRLPKVGKGPEIDKEKALNLIDTAIRGGINYFDTAWYYHNGLSESFAGEALSRYPRNSYYLATKLPITLIENRKQAEDIFNKQLEKCKVDYFDFYLIHELNGSRWKKSLDSGAIDFAMSLRDQGKIKRLGFSFHGNNNDFKEIIKYTNWDFVQIQANYVDWDVFSKEQYDIANELKIPVIVMEPLRGGELANIGLNAEEILKKCRPDLTSAQWAFKFFASKNNILTVLSGMTLMEHLNENLVTFSPLEPLTDDEENVLHEAMKIYREGGKVSCTGCRYCMPCPVGVSIPDIFKIYNDYRMKLQDPNYYNFKAIREAKKKYDALGKNAKAENCVNCGACLKKCPQGISIPEELKRIHKELV